jgi:hypothetical protein
MRSLSTPAIASNAKIVEAFAGAVNHLANYAPAKAALKQVDAPCLLAKLSTTLGAASVPTVAKALDKLK